MTCSATSGAGERVQFLVPKIELSGELTLLAFAVLVGVGIAAGIPPPCVPRGSIRRWRCGMSSAATRDS